MALNGASDDAAFRLGYRPALDGLRGLALVVVVLFHAQVPWVRAGHAGLTVFFVLSGFLITVLLLQERRDHGAVRLVPFYARRALRIYPALVIFVVAVGVYVQLTAAPDTAAAQWQAGWWVLGGLANIQHIYGDVPLLLLTHTWSIAVELQFYVVWPLFLLAAVRAGVPWRRILGATAAVAGLVLLARELWWLAANQDPDRASVLVALREPARALTGERVYPRFLTGTDLRLDHLLIGCGVGLLAFHGRLRPLRERPWLVSASSVVALAYLAWFVVVVDVQDDGWRRFLFSGGSTLVALATAVLIVAVLLAPGSPVPRLLTSRLLVWLGTISYGVYLWHVPLYRVLREQDLGLSLWQLTAAGAAGSVVLALISYHGAERWALAQKERLSPVDRRAEDRSAEAVVP